jgi:hypothetical protein
MDRFKFLAMGMIIANPVCVGCCYRVQGVCSYPLPPGLRDHDRIRVAGRVWGILFEVVTEDGRFFELMSVNIDSGTRRKVDRDALDKWDRDRNRLTP